MQFTTGELRLTPAPLNFKHKIGWDATLPIFARSSYRPGAPPIVSVDYKVLLMHIACCPRCGNHCPAAPLRLCPRNLDKPATCCGCGKTSTAHHWLCTCGCKWHLCTVHKPLPLAPSKLLPRLARRVPKRPRVHSRHSLLDQELERESKHARCQGDPLEGSADIEFFPAPSRPLTAGMLPVSLRERFPHAFV